MRIAHEWRRICIRGASSGRASPLPIAHRPRRERRHLFEERNIMSENVKEITEDSFQSEVLSGSTPVLVDFWAPWCGPCKRIAPIVEELAAEYGGKVKFVKVDVDGNPGIAANFGIQSIPTLMLFKGGQAVDRIIGAVMKEKIKETIDKQL